MYTVNRKQNAEVQAGCPFGKRKDAGIQCLESRGCYGRNEETKVMTYDELKEKYLWSREFSLGVKGALCTLVEKDVSFRVSMVMANSCYSGFQEWDLAPVDWDLCLIDPCKRSMYSVGCFSHRSVRTVSGSSSISCGLRAVGRMSGAQAKTSMMFPFSFMAAEFWLTNRRLVLPQTVETMSDSLNPCPSLLSISDYLTTVGGVGTLAVETFFRFWLARFPGIKLFFLCLSEERTSNWRGDSIGGVIKLGTCFKDSNFLYDRFSQLLEFPFRVVTFTS